MAGLQQPRIQGTISLVPSANARLLVLPPNAEAARVCVGGCGDGSERAGVPRVDEDCAGAYGAGCF